MDTQIPLMQRKILSQRGLVDLYGTGRKNVIFLPILTDALQKVRARAMALTDHNTDQALEPFTTSVLRASVCMKKQTNKIKQKFVLESVSKILCGLMTYVEWQKMMLSPC